MQDLQKENLMLKSRMEMMRVQMAKMATEMKNLKDQNEDLTKRVEFLEQGYINKSQFDGMYAMIMNSFESMKSKQDALFAMISQTTSTINDPNLNNSIMDYVPMFESLSDSYEGDSFDGMFNENALEEYCVNETPVSVNVCVVPKNCYKKNNNHESRKRPELTESTEVVYLNY